MAELAVILEKLAVDFRKQPVAFRGARVEDQAPLGVFLRFREAAQLEEAAGRAEARLARIGRRLRPPAIGGNRRPVLFRFAQGASVQG